MYNKEHNIKIYKTGRKNGLIEVKNLTKNYGPVAAVKGISFTVEKGHIYGFLGPNGAGKSTTMNMITGCLAPTSGEVTISGFDIIDDAVDAKRCIGYLPEIPPLYTDMTPFEMLEFVGRAKKIKKAQLYDEIESVMEKTGILDVADRLIKNLSKGYKQRVGIAVALMGNPDIIILDEPPGGLDPIQIMEVRDLIRELGEEHTVILSSHILQEISAVCDYVIMISKGTIVASDTLENLLSQTGDAKKLKVETTGTEEELRNALADISEISSLSVTEGEKTALVIETDKNSDIREKVILALTGNGHSLLSISEEQASLEDVFVRLAGESLDAGAAYAMEKEAEKQEKLEAKRGKKVKVQSSLGPAYYDEEYIKEEPEAEEAEEEYSPLFSAESEEKEDDEQ